VEGPGGHLLLLPATEEFFGIAAREGELGLEVEPRPSFSLIPALGLMGAIYAIIVVGIPFSTMQMV
jgi:hypothetical protein